jgi:DNA-binding CsgD family transcriptional regulator
MDRARLGIRAQAAREAIAELAEQPLPPRELLDEVDERVRRIVPVDTAGWWTSDPDSLLPIELFQFDIEEVRREVKGCAHYDELDRAGRGVSAISSHPASALPAASGPQPFVAGGHKLRVLSRSAGASWGMACIARGSDLPPFSGAEMAFVEAVASDVGEALRVALGRTALADENDSQVGPGTVILDTDLAVEGATRDARYWLDRLGVDPDGPVPASMQWAALQAKAGERLTETGRAVRPARVRVPLDDGTWIVVQADVLAGTESPRTALTLRPAGRAEMLPLRLALHGLTPREAEVSTLLANGRSTDDIARTLHLSRHTVRDYTKAIFGKVGVHSRPEFTTLLSTGARAA